MKAKGRVFGWVLWLAFVGVAIKATALKRGEEVASLVAMGFVWGTIGYLAGQRAGR